MAHSKGACLATSGGPQLSHPRAVGSENLLVVSPTTSKLLYPAVGGQSPLYLSSLFIPDHVAAAVSPLFQDNQVFSHCHLMRNPIVSMEKCAADFLK